MSQEYNFIILHLMGSINSKKKKIKSPSKPLNINASEF